MGQKLNMEMYALHKLFILDNWDSCFRTLVAEIIRLDRSDPDHTHQPMEASEGMPTAVTVHTGWIDDWSPNHHDRQDSDLGVCQSPSPLQAGEIVTYLEE